MGGGGGPCGGEATIHGVGHEGGLRAPHGHPQRPGRGRYAKERHGEIASQAVGASGDGVHHGGAVLRVQGGAAGVQGKDCVCVRYHGGLRDIPLECGEERVVHAGGGSGARGAAERECDSGWARKDVGGPAGASDQVQPPLREPHVRPGRPHPHGKRWTRGYHRPSADEQAGERGPYGLRGLDRLRAIPVQQGGRSTARGD
mmetsp:Transcript_22659/g.70365  ORF Transcript_22659/g.70365 Transcript_22659/m.70365 type:complete len:201 (-) Transcript_22659:728-1330(-)